MVTGVYSIKAACFLSLVAVGFRTPPDIIIIIIAIITIISFFFFKLDSSLYKYIRRYTHWANQSLFQNKSISSIYNISNIFCGAKGTRRVRCVSVRWLLYKQAQARTIDYAMMKSIIIHGNFSFPRLTFSIGMHLCLYNFQCARKNIIGERGVMFVWGDLGLPCAERFIFIFKLKLRVFWAQMLPKSKVNNNSHNR